MVFRAMTLAAKAVALTAMGASADTALRDVQTWMYQLQHLDRDSVIEALEAAPYDMYVLEPGQNFDGWTNDPERIVARLGTRPDGSPRVLLAYLNIGQTESYRDYWGADWVAPSAGQPGVPDYMVTVDPDGWSNNFPVAYWDPRWQALMAGSDGIVADLARLGFDGLYLDWVAGYWEPSVMAAAEAAGVDPREAMIEFIARLRAAGRAVNPDFLIVPQNAPDLIDTDPTRYLSLIDAIAVEDTWFSGIGGSDWDDPAGGDQRDPVDGLADTADDLADLAPYLEAGLPVFSVDYALRPENVTLVYQEARAAGLVPLVTRVSLERISPTPPPWLPE